MNFKIYKFSAKWCGPCKQLAPVLNELLVNAELSSYFEEIDIEENEEMVEEYGIKVLPTTIFLKDSQILHKIESFDVQKIKEAVLNVQKMKENSTRQTVEFVPIDITAAIKMDF